MAGRERLFNIRALQGSRWLHCAAPRGSRVCQKPHAVDEDTEATPRAPTSPAQRTQHAVIMTVNVSSASRK